MENNEKALLRWIFIVLGVIALLINGILIIVAKSIKKREWEINLALGLAAVDIILSCITMAGVITTLVAGKDIINIPELCRIKGPIDFIGLYASMLIVSLVAVLRYSRVFSVPVSYTYWSFLVVTTCLYFSLVGMLIIRGEFIVSPSGIDCAPRASTSFISASVIFLNGLSMFTFVCIALFCYLHIVFVVAKVPNRDGRFVSMKEGNLQRDLPPLSYRLRRSIRPLVICFTYFTLIVPSCILILFEATDKFTVVIERTSMIISICLYSTSLTNPLLVLFAHSVIYHQLTQSFANFLNAHSFNSSSTLL